MFHRFVRAVVGGLLGITLLAAVVGGAGGYAAWLHFSADLPDVDGGGHQRPTGSSST